MHDSLLGLASAVDGLHDEVKAGTHLTWSYFILGIL